MSAFRALNVESDNESEDEVDNTKEIQIEDALKLYQAALKYHSEGPQSFDKAAEAYKALFESEIFKYPESLSEYRRHELYGDTLEFDNIFQEDFEAGPVPLPGGNDSAPNTLPQVLHLAYKNRGQLVLEMMRHQLQHPGDRTHEEGSRHVLAALNFFAEALDKDDADLDLWSRTASVAAMLGSSRITRFCLEAVLDGDDELIDSVLRLPGLEEGFAGQQLRELVSKLEDNLSLAQAPLASMRRKKLSEALKRRLNPYPFAPLPSEIVKIGQTPILGREVERITLNPSKWDWAGVGEVILHHFMAEQNGFTESAPGTGIAINIPPDMVAEADNEINESQSNDDVVNGGEENIQSGNAGANTSVSDVDGDVKMADRDKETATKTENSDSATPTNSARVPQSRKRSTDSAGLPETAEGGRIRSKRLRAKDAIVEGSADPDTAAQELAKQRQDQLAPLIQADQYLFEIMNDIFAKLGVKGLGSPAELRELTGTGAHIHEDRPILKAAKDMYMALQSGDSKIPAVILTPETVDLGGMSREAGLNAFLGYAKSGISQTCAKPTLGRELLGKFAHLVNSQWITIKQVAFAWVETLLCPGSFPNPSRSNQASRSSYIDYRWTEDLKRHLVQIIVNFDEFFYEQCLDRISGLSARVLNAEADGHPHNLSTWDTSQIEMVQTLFELHLDIYSLIKHPHSGVDSVTQIVQHDRLERWASMARDALQLRTDCTVKVDLDELALRHIWASVFHMSVTDEIEPEHILYAMEELKAIFQFNDGPTIEVQNNAVMPKLSVAAVDRELARINMKDFFLKVFDQDEKEPVVVIESLEPILESAQYIEEPNNRHDDVESRSSTMSGQYSDRNFEEVPISKRSALHEMRNFLDTASVPLRLSLWQRLREAYEAIEYSPKVVSCYLRSIETLMGEFKSSAYHDAAAPDRHVKLLSRLRIIDEVLVKVLQIIRTDKSAFDCLSYEHLQSTMSALSELLQILSLVNVFEDMVRIEQIPAPRFEGCPSNTFVLITVKMHDIQLRTWILQYQLLKEGISQNLDAFPSPSEDQFEYLRHVHYATGIRGFCHAAARTFLRCAKDEVLRLDDVMDGNTRDNELSQILYDLYGLKTFINNLDCHDYSSAPELLDKKTAVQILPFILQQARKINIKDLPKTELKVTIDKVHGALGRTKQNDDISWNRKALITYFKSPINPISLFNSVKGVGTLATKYIHPESAVPASLGWYYLMGNIALNKFRSQKRPVAGPTEDLNFAQAFFLQDLEYTIDRWETWYRLAQTNDCQLEEAVSWSAEKLNNNNSNELLHFQRTAIHCYTMAVACAVRDADISPLSASKLSELYTEFGNRIYSSSRQPFCMHAFALLEKEHKYYSGHTTNLVYQSVPFNPLSPYSAWKFASVLFKRAIAANPDKWWNHYMLGKCLWKMFRADSDTVSAHRPVARNKPTWEDVVDAFISAVETLPEKKEKRDPILEPHYKLVSIAHKLVQLQEITYEKGEEILQNTPYSANVAGPDNLDDWERYVLDVLQALRTADKSGWHHRMTSRAAHVLYDEASGDSLVARAAKHKLTEQMFTKTMVLQVWKPENERPGRHFVYTTRYTRFFINLLVQLNDRVNLEILAKRVRKKPHEFFEHTKLWTDLCLAYLKLLRRAGQVPDSHEDAVFKSLSNEEFQSRAALVEAWCQAPTSQHIVLDVLRDVVELKRLNNNLMKPLLIDDLIGDTYALLYATVGPTLEPAQMQQTGGQASTSGSSAMATQLDGASYSHPTAMEMQHTILPEHTSRPRAKGVGRREIQRKAEAAIVRATAPLLTSTNANRNSSPPVAAHLQIPSNSKEQAPPDSAAGLSRLAQLQVPHSGTTTAPGSVTNVESSAPASMHDSADDESGLSELDDQEMQEMAEASDIHYHHEGTVVKSMFPNLANKMRDNSQADDSVVTSTAGSPEGHESDA